MKHWLRSAAMTAAVMAFAGFAYAAMTSMTGEVTKFEAGKSITVKDEKGKEHRLEITKDTKTEGEVKAGAKVTVHVDGMKAQDIKATMAH